MKVDVGRNGPVCRTCGGDGCCNNCSGTGVTAFGRCLWCDETGHCPRCNGTGREFVEDG
jgi:hypothetical protein